VEEKKRSLSEKRRRSIQSATGGGKKGKRKKKIELALPAPEEEGKRGKFVGFPPSHPCQRNWGKGRKEGE